MLPKYVACVCVGVCFPFSGKKRWIIRPAADEEGGGKRRCTATVTWRCVWHKFTVIKGLIEGKCRADVKSFNIAFLQVW